MIEGKELREYQSSIVGSAISSDKDIIICLPTGSGKTVIASAIIDRLSCKVIFIVPRLELIKQAKEEFGDVDIIWKDKTSITGKHCILASKESLRRQYDNLPQELKDDIHDGVIIIDEAHVSIKQSFNLVQMLNPKRVIGLTATPERMDGYALLKGDDGIHKFGIFDEVLQKETVPSLINKGYLSPLKYYARPIEGIAKIKPDNPLAEELSDKQMIKIFNEHNIWGDLVNSYEEYGKGRPTIGFTSTVALGEKVVKLFVDAGYDFRIIHGGMPVAERQALIEQLRTRAIDGLVNAELLTYGFDCPPVSYAFNCRHIKSRPLWFQIVGRILRPCEGKENAIFVDHADSIAEFSEPDCSLPILDETIRWRTNGESKELRKIRRQSMKKVQETMALIQELDPQPAELVEITVENTWERLIRILKRLYTENEQLTLDKKDLSAQIKQAEVKQNILQEKLLNAQRENMHLAEENKKAKNAVQKTIDSDQTFDYIRRHYIAYRRDVESVHRGIPRDEAHALTLKRLKGDEARLSFYFDEAIWKRSTRYWYENYEKRINS